MGGKLQTPTIFAVALVLAFLAVIPAGNLLLLLFLHLFASVLVLAFLAVIPAGNLLPLWRSSQSTPLNYPYDKPNTV